MEASGGSDARVLRVSISVALIAVNLFLVFSVYIVMFVLLGRTQSNGSLCNVVLCSVV